MTSDEYNRLASQRFRAALAAARYRVRLEHQVGCDVVFASASNLADSYRPRCVR